MKRLLLMLSILIVATSAGVAQDGAAQPAPPPAPAAEEPAGGPSFGIKGWFGASLPTFTGLPDGITTKSDVAWAAGAFFNWSTKGVISLGIQPELMYVSETGIKTNVPFNGEAATAEVTTTVNSVRLPVLAKLQFLDPHIVQPSIYVGPSFSYAVSATNSANGQSVDIDDAGFQVGLAAGIDVTVLSVLVADVRVNTKFTPLTYNVGELVDNVELSMASVKFGLGLRF